MSLPAIPPNESLFGRGLLEPRMTVRLVVVPLHFLPDGSVSDTGMRLRSQRVATFTAVRELADRVAGENRAFTPAEQARWELLRGAVDVLDSMIATGALPSRHARAPVAAVPLRALRPPGVIKMTTLQIPVDEITASAREVKFSRVALTIFLGVFYILGWTAGHAWVGVVMAGYSVRRGWREGQGITAPAKPLQRT